jgi:hypothetical protein
VPTPLRSPLPPPSPPQRARAAASNQDYLNRTIDQAEAKAAKALRHLRLQLQRLRALNAALRDAAALPALLLEVSERSAALRARCGALSAAAARAEEAAAAAAPPPGGRAG